MGTGGKPKPGHNSNRNSDRCRLPLSCRPGPFIGSDGSAITSSLIAVTPLCFAVNEIAYVSVSGALPPQSKDPSGCLLYVVPFLDTKADGSRRCQTAWCFSM